jgi:tetratricopeptide (TPR) repeat protein
MITRSTVIATVLGALGAALGVYAGGQMTWQQLLAARLSAPDREAEVTLAIEAWPICTTMGSIKADADWAQLDPDFAAGKKALSAGNWRVAIRALELAALRDPRNADIQNYIGYAHRHLGQFEPALTHYQRALMLNPRHRSAHSHLGEMYLVRGDLLKAEEHLAALERICLIPCDEYGDLKGAIAMYENSAMR